MLDQKNMNGQRGQTSPAGGVKKNLAGLTHDLISLAELQAQLVAVDLRDSYSRSVVPAVLVVTALLLALGAMPVILLGIGWPWSTWPASAKAPPSCSSASRRSGWPRQPAGGACRNSRPRSVCSRAPDANSLKTSGGSNRHCSASRHSQNCTGGTCNSVSRFQPTAIPITTNQGDPDESGNQHA